MQKNYGKYHTCRMSVCIDWTLQWSHAIFYINKIVQSKGWTVKRTCPGKEKKGRTKREKRGSLPLARYRRWRQLTHGVAGAPHTCRRFCLAKPRRPGPREGARRFWIILFFADSTACIWTRASPELVPFHGKSLIYVNRYLCFLNGCKSFTPIYSLRKVLQQCQNIK
jgi:hypothetical protein